MRKRIKQILRENDFGWVSQSEGSEFRSWLEGRLSNYNIGSGTLDDLEEYMAELETSRFKEFIYMIEDVCEYSYESGKEDGYEDGSSDGYDSGHADGYDEGLYDCDCTDQCEDECSDKWDDG